jgi:hypothetical protein
MVDMESNLTLPNLPVSRGNLPGESSLAEDVATRVSRGGVEMSAVQEVQPGVSSAGVSALPAPQLPISSPQAQNTASSVSVQTAKSDDNPQGASEDEVIEKEWVDRAKMIVTQTREDPHEQEREVSKLQADYLKKRYGKEVRLSND